ncbi:unnamed protein product [Hymenolepis diminuta]|uniref:Uncharacterized protein n=1 Tax=Hymenolepis diminuta TaxID=6216 RepID=A0A0R3SYL3_HYMDI|nr:unnamed protein product [Hymenolepis diminuta]
MERRTDFEMKATEPADVVDVVGDDCEEEDCEESDGATEGDEFVTVAGVAGSDGSAVVFGSALVPLSAKTTTTNRSRMSERHI